MNIVSSLLTPRKKKHAPPPSPPPPAAPVEKKDDDVNSQGNDSDDGRVNFDLSWNNRPRRTPVASKMSTPRRQSLPRETPPRYARRLGQPSPRIALSEIWRNHLENREFVEAAKRGGAPGLNAEGETTTAEAEFYAEAGKDEEEEEAMEDGGSDTSIQEYTFKRFLSHRWAENSIEIEVEWEGFSETTWEPEVNLQQDAPDALFAYWRSQKGGRPMNPFDPDLFEVFAIRKHSKDRKRYLVEWVGFEPKEASWVTRQALEETAEDVITEYWDDLDAKKKKK